jgi:hypothetical protein
MQRTQLDSATTTDAPRATPVARYTYHLFSSRTEDDVVIFLYDGKANVIGQVFFVADDLPLPPAADTRGCVALFFPRSRRAAVLDMLRNEGPIDLRWAGPFDSCISTEYEPVGEGEAATPRQRGRIE